MVYPFVVSILLITIGTVLYVRSRSRSAIEVAQDIRDSFLDITSSSFECKNEKPNFLTLLTPLLASLFVALAQEFLFHRDLREIVILTLITLGLVYLIQQRRDVLRKQQKESDIDYYLPIVMERIVMAVEAGLDIIPAIQTIVELELKDPSANGEVDPVTKLFSRIISLIEAGLSFDAALQEGTLNVSNRAIKHAFIHLGVAYREGGEILGPLRELSDATQLYYQETVEEQIAKMPVRATAPLVLTFAGLIIFFLASPLVQVLSFAEKAVPTR